MGTRHGTHTAKSPHGSGEALGFLGMRCQGVETEVQVLKPPRRPGAQNRLDAGVDQLPSALQKPLPCPLVPSTLARSQNPVSSVGKVVNSTSLWRNSSPHLWSSMAPEWSESRASSLCCSRSTLAYLHRLPLLSGPRNSHPLLHAPLD